MRCDSCELVAINGVPCHETGCPDAWKSYARDCRECGTSFKPEERYQRECSPCCAAAYAGFACECDSCEAFRREEENA